jgi:pimeloyl-ACP methyl ester carboxylesterase
MLFLHGFPECWYSWRDQLVHFRTQYEVVAVDMRGYNTSSKPKARHL